MNKKIFLVFLAVFFLSAGTILAVDQSSQEIYQTFLGKYRYYTSLKKDYDTAKAKYLSYQSVASRDDYLNKAKTFFKSEVDSSSEYAKLLRVYLVEATSVLNYQENLYFIRLDDELTFLSSLPLKTDEASSVAELMTIWKDFETHYKTVSKYGYMIKIYVEIGSVEKVFENLKITKDKLSAYLSETSAENKYLSSAKDSFLVSEKKFSDISEKVTQLKNIRNTMQANNELVRDNQSVRNDINVVSDKMLVLVSDYKNILKSIAQ